MSKSTLGLSWEPENVRRIYIKDTSVDTVRHWERISYEELALLTAPQKQIYDMRQLKNISIFALRTAVKVKRHKNADLTYTAILAHNSVVINLINTVLAIQPGGQFKIFAEEVDALVWLNEKVPD